MLNLRLIDKRFVEGILVPFTHRSYDSYNTRWDVNTDFGINPHQFHQRPIFYRHGLKRRGTNEPDSIIYRIGTLFDDGFEVTPDGLLARGELQEDSHNGYALREAVDKLTNNRARWSSGVFPHHAFPPDAHERDGYYSRWWVAEGSILDKDDASDRSGLTTASFMRTMGYSTDGQSSDSFLVRSPYIGDTIMLPQQTGNPPAPPEPSLADVLSAVNNMNKNMQALTVRVDAIEKDPVTPLAATNAGDNPHLRGAPAPIISVYSKFDDLNLYALLLRDRFLQIENTRKGVPHVRTEEFMRVVVEKMAAQRELDTKSIEHFDNRRPLYAPLPVRMVDAEAIMAWHNRVPYLRANEAMQSTLANFGDELVPTLLNTVAFWYFRMESKVLQLFNVFDMPSQPFDYPVITSYPTMHKVAEIANQSNFNIPSTLFTPSKPGTTKVTFTAGKMGGMVLVSRELFEDAGIAVAPVISQSLAIAMGQNIDYILLHADKTDTKDNISWFSAAGDSPTTDGQTRLLVVNGLRKQVFGTAYDEAHATISADSPATLGRLQGTRGAMGLDIPNRVIVGDCGVGYAFNALTDYESMADVGVNATLLTGMVGAAKGVPIVVTDQWEKMDSAGRIPEGAASGTVGGLLSIWRPGVLVGKRRDVEISPVQAIPGTDGLMAEGTVRLDIQIMQPGAVAYGFNTTVTV